MTDWFRSWHGAPTDNKWLLIGRKSGQPPGMVAALVWAMLDHASQHADRGRVDDFDFETYAEFSGFRRDKLAAIFACLVSKGVVVNGRLAAWDKRQPKREDGSAARTKEWRNRKKAESDAAPDDVTQCDATERTVTQCDSRVEEIRKDSGDDARARPLVSPEATKLADEIAAIAGHPDPKKWPPGWFGATMRVQAMLGHGWQPELILAAVRAAAARKRDGPAESLGYFEKAIARAHAQQAAPLPSIEAENAGIGNPGNAYRQPSSRGGFAALAFERARAASED